VQKGAALETVPLVKQQFGERLLPRRADFGIERVMMSYVRGTS
jgi:hypothetical protein